MKPNFFIRQSWLYYRVVTFSILVRYALTASLLLGIICAWTCICYLPITSFVNQLNHQINGLQEQQRSVHALLKKMPRIRTRLAAKKQEWLGLLHNAEQTAHRSAFLLCALAQQNNIILERFIPGKKQEKGWLAKQPILIELSGATENIIRFLYELAYQDLLLKIRVCTLKRSDEAMSLHLTFDQVTSKK